jgi:hypothetical protein
MGNGTRILVIVLNYFVPMNCSRLNNMLVYVLVPESETIYGTKIFFLKGDKRNNIFVHLYISNHIWEMGTRTEKQFNDCLIFFKSNEVVRIFLLLLLAAKFIWLVDCKWYKSLKPCVLGFLGYIPITHTFYWQALIRVNGGWHAKIKKLKNTFFKSFFGMPAAIVK